MACGCGTNHQDGKSVVNRVREKGMQDTKMKQAYRLRCTCGEEFTMDTYVSKCPKCNMVYGVTPCSSDDPKNIRKAEINY